MPDLIAPLFFLAAGLLVVSGGAKVWRPDRASQALAAIRLPSGRPAVRGLGCAEAAAGAWALFDPTPWSSLALAGIYVAFAAFLAALIASGTTVGCGCAGTRDAPPSRVHIALDLFAAGTAVMVAASHGIRPAPAFLAGQSLAGIPLLIGLVGLALALRAVVSEAPAWLRELSASSRIGHRHGRPSPAPALLQISSPRSRP